ncbi:MAG: diguanylate cyclase [Spirochaetaceae bacterium]|nr:diguanylate cyclase [Spirochaetaceae bacterium]
MVIEQSFIKIEEDYALKNLTRTENSLNREVYNLDILLQDWSFWDDTYHFISTKSPEYIISNLVESTFYSSSLSLIYFFDLDWNLIWGEMYNPEEEEKITSASFTNEYIKNPAILFDKGILEMEDSQSAVKKGYLLTREGLLYLISRPVFRSDETGPPVGSMIMGKMITDTYQDLMKERIQSDFRIYNSEDLLSDNKRIIIFEDLMQSKNDYYIEKDTDKISIYKILNNINDNPQLLLETSINRDITKYGTRTMNIFRIGIIIFILMMTLILILIFEEILTKPILKISSFLKSVDTEENTSKSLYLNRRDEIGYLADSIDKFINRINIQKEDLLILNKELKKLATSDALTGLSNRHILDTHIPNLWKTLSRDKSPMSVVMIDIDHFKLYNDNYGHQSGDECIKTVAQILKSILNRSTDMVIRYGGEEFLVILPSTPLEGAVKVAELIQSELIKEKIEHKKSDVSDFLTVSIGVSAINPNEDNNLNLLIEQADNALYTSKETGRNKITVYS